MVGCTIERKARGMHCDSRDVVDRLILSKRSGPYRCINPALFSIFACVPRHRHAVGSSVRSRSIIFVPGSSRIDNPPVRPLSTCLIPATKTYSISFRTDNWKTCCMPTFSNIAFMFAQVGVHPRAEASVRLMDAWKREFNTRSSSIGFRIEY